MKVKLCYYNQHWNIYLYSEDQNLKWWENRTLKTVQDNRGEFRLREHKHPEIPVFTFGFMCNNPKERPGHGGEWSSNSTAINKVFGTDLIEIALDQLACSVSIKWIKELLGDKVKWSTDSIYGHMITEVIGHENTYHAWREIDITQTV